MKVFTNSLAQRIHKILFPLIGDLMSANILKVQCKKIGIDEESINVNHLPQLAEGIKLGLILFLGTDASSQVEQKIINLGNL
ncbi:MAG TPA: hypothetical protein VHO50_02925 [Bacteroidales bacterium]|nr:hypothetical protein [Bacteroidales bacterium]